MTIKETIDRDIKTAMLGGDKTLVTTLRGLKSVILYAEVAKGSRDVGLPEAEVIDLLAKELKKRQESAEMYDQGGNAERAAAERLEKEVITKYLPAQLSEAELLVIIDGVVTKLGVTGPQMMGQVIGAVKAQTAGTAEGSVIARLVKEKLTQ